jgi:hypothetical protein
MTPELKARIAKDGLFKTTRLMQLEKRAAMPQSSTFYHPRRKSGVSWIAPLEPKPVEEIKPLKSLSVTSIDSEELDLEDEPTPLDGEVCAPVALRAAGEDELEPESDEESGDSQDDVGIA